MRSSAIAGFSSSARQSSRRERRERRGGGAEGRAERPGASRAANGEAPAEGRGEGRVDGTGEGRGEGRAGGRAEREIREVVVDLRRAEGETAAAAENEDRPSRARVFLTLGQKDGADEAKVRAAVTALAPDLALLAVEVRLNHSFLEVAPEDVERAVAALNGKELEGKALTAEKARRRRR